MVGSRWGGLWCTSDALVLTCSALLLACGGSDAAPPAGGEEPSPTAAAWEGNPASAPGGCDVPLEARAEDASTPDQVVGNGTQESCTADAFRRAVAAGGVITFDCGDDPVTIVLDAPAKVYNDASDKVVIDGGNKVTLSGGGKSRILYMNTCDEELVWTTDHCDDQEFPQLTLQNLRLVDANSTREGTYDGGGAVWVRGGRVKVIHSTFENNVCADEGPDVGGGALRVTSQYHALPVYVVDSTFGGGAGKGNACSNGGALSSIGVSWQIYDSVFTDNRALGEGGNPAQMDTPGGGSGGAIYNDGNTMTLALCGSVLENNQARAYGSAIFFVSNNHDGTLRIDSSHLRDNTGGGWNVMPGISMHEDTRVLLNDSVIQ